MYLKYKMNTEYTFLITYKNHNFYLSWYYDYDIVIIKNDELLDYVNASNLFIKENKDFDTWKISNEQLINYYYPLPTYINVPNKLLAGTYVHPNLVPSILMCISNSFNVIMKNIINNYAPPVKYIDFAHLEVYDTIAQMMNMQMNYEFIHTYKYNNKFNNISDTMYNK
ncbi:KilA-N domain-containing protein [Alphaentomopoxvirus acuprea]|uniref:KilA-N domain-containing protein n=1 Tax=Alphaentomopoxvirus acuprea TaxID=62099 RepID=W6JL57_9POXV|nr:KilA-N domain-containing protein [Anomala cuprea entomopoxvirus]BAO49580.1 KilA-N domain-containing protein [Anomala cuprea entomopoxvirus]